MIIPDNHFAAPGQDDVFGGFGGLGFEVRHNNVTMFLSGEYLALTNSGSIAATRAG